MTRSGGPARAALARHLQHSRDALDYVRGLGNMRAIRIDGTMLLGLMIDQDVGVRAERTITLKRLNIDYFEDAEHFPIHPLHRPVKHTI